MRKREKQIRVKGGITVNRVARSGLTEKVTLNQEGGESVSPVDPWGEDGKDAVGIQNSQCQSPKAGD